MPYQVCVDESGGRGQGQHFVMAGVMAYADKWAAFSEEWSTRLASSPSVRYFKMKEAAGLSGEFHRFTKDERDEKLKSLARIINKYVDAAIYIAVDVQGFSQTFAKAAVDYPLAEMYFHAFHIMTMGACFDLWETGLRERFEIIFDEHDLHGDETKRFYPIVRSILTQTDPEACTILPVDPIFRDDEEFLPLQAADLYAWCFRKGGDGSSDQLHPFAWLLPELTSVSLSKFCQVLDTPRMDNIMEDTNRRLASGAINKDLLARYKKMIGE